MSSAPVDAGQLGEQPGFALEGVDRDPDRLVTQAELAELQGCSRQYISKLAGLGRLDFIDGKIRLGDALKMLGADIGATTDDVSFNKARTDTEIWKSKRARLEYERESGALVRADRVDSTVFTAFFELKEKIFEQLPGLSGKILRAGSPREAQAVAEDAFTDLFIRVAEEFERRWQNKAG